MAEVDAEKALLGEVNLLRRLIYKNRNQHRRAKYFQTLVQVHKQMHALLSLSPPRDAFQDLRRMKGTGGPLDPHRKQTATVGGVSLTPLLKSRAWAQQVVSQIHPRLIHSARFLLGLVSQGFFLPLAVTLVCALARCRQLLLQIAAGLLKEYSALVEELPPDILKKESLQDPHCRSQPLLVPLELSVEGPRVYLRQCQPVVVDRTGTLPSANQCPEGEGVSALDSRGRTGTTRSRVNSPASTLSEPPPDWSEPVPRKQKESLAADASRDLETKGSGQVAAASASGFAGSNGNVQTAGTMPVNADLDGGSKAEVPRPTTEAEDNMREGDERGALRPVSGSHGMDSGGADAPTEGCSGVSSKVLRAAPPVDASVGGTAASGDGEDAVRRASPGVAQSDAIKKAMLDLGFGEFLGEAPASTPGRKKRKKS